MDFIFFPLTVIFFSSISVHAEENTNIEIFDITRGKVVKALQADSKVREMAIKYLQGIKGVYGRLDPIPDKGYAIGISLEPSVKVQGKWLNTLVNDVVIMFPDNESPFLVVIDNENKLLCFYFNGDTDKLLNKLDFKLN